VGVYVLGARAGADIFFVLSGYLITTLLANELSATAKIDYRNFYIRRFCDCGLPSQRFSWSWFSRSAMSEGPKTGSFEAVAVSRVYLMTGAERSFGETNINSVTLGRLPWRSSSIYSGPRCWR